MNPQPAPPHVTLNTPFSPPKLQDERKHQLTLQLGDAEYRAMQRMVNAGLFETLGDGARHAIWAQCDLYERTGMVNDLQFEVLVRALRSQRDTEWSENRYADIEQATKRIHNQLTKLMRDQDWDEIEERVKAHWTEFSGMQWDYWRERYLDILRGLAVFHAAVRQLIQRGYHIPLTLIDDLMAHPLPLPQIVPPRVQEQEEEQDD